MYQSTGKGHDNRAARWPADRVAKLKQLWPIMTASQIGRVMGLTREAICGKVFRLKLPLKKPDRLLVPKRGGQPPKSVYVSAPRISAPLIPETVLPDMPAPKFLDRTLDDLGMAECHYPHGDQAPYRFCAQPCDGKSCYCGYHRRLSYHRILPARRNFEWVR
jgi:hypothetical protein